MSSSSTVCIHCGLATASTGAYCCYGCELAGTIAAEGKQERTEHYAVITFSLLLSMVVMMLSLFLFAEDVYGAGPEAGLEWMRKAYRVVAAVLSTPVVLMLGVPLARRALNALRAGRLTMDLLVAAGAAAAYVVSLVAIVRGQSGVYFDSATSALLLSTLGRYLEATARAAASRVVGPLLKLSATPVLAKRAGAADYERISPAEITPGIELRIEVEEVLPVDARVVEGPAGTAAEVDVTLGVLTGAATPVTRTVGDDLPAGAVPVSGPLTCVALRPARESTLERLAELSRSLKERPTRLQRLADSFAGALVPLVTMLATAVFVVNAMHASFDRAVIASLAVVLAACPCTYGVATPLVLWLALRKGLEQGVCIRNAAVLEELAAVKAVAFDKTGTLTRPELSVLDAHLSSSGAEAETKALVASLEAGSRHPVALALTQWASAGMTATLSDRRMVVGAGVEARDATGRRILLGSARWLEREGIAVGLAEGGGEVRVALVREGQVLARFEIGEATRLEARTALTALGALGVEALMLTGDTEAGARQVAGPLGIEAHAALSPEQKLERLERLGKTAAMVGDGVNDAPALAAIGPSFAMEGGTGLARGMAQVTLLKDDLRLVPWTVALARRAMQMGRQNLVSSTLYNLFFLTLAATGMLRPVWAGVSMLTSSLLTLASSLRVNTVPGPSSNEASEATPALEALKRTPA